MRALPVPGPKNSVKDEQKKTVKNCRKEQKRRKRAEEGGELCPKN